jgi:hypothetical protein
MTPHRTPHCEGFAQNIKLWSPKELIVMLTFLTQAPLAELPFLQKNEENDHY